jgi:hypothetical protein
MEPKSSEQLPTPVEYTPSATGNETGPARQPERVEPNFERGSEQLQQTTVTPVVDPVVVLPTPVPQLQVADDVQQIQSDDSPATAADDDLIEKEWVDKAKKIIAETKDDPRKREKEVGKLQIDYLKKRYGKDLGEST